MTMPVTPEHLEAFSDIAPKAISTAGASKRNLVYLITPASVSKHIAYIEEVRPVATSPDTSRPVATPVVPGESHQETRQETPASDLSRPVAAAYIERVESENEFLRKQIGVKDDQIKDLTERARETNFLIQGLQNLFLQLNPGRPSDSARNTPPATPQ